jgi:hypothetical protein
MLIYIEICSVLNNARDLTRDIDLLARRTQRPFNLCVALTHTDPCLRMTHHGGHTLEG